jgi:shikimate kinase
MVLWLIGMMGSGKTTVGEAVAAELGLSFVDTDVLISSVTASSIPDLWERNGEASFRDLERQMIASAADSGPSVVATGGGAVLDDTNIAKMRSSGLVLWLTASPQTLEERIGRAGGRPLLAEGVARERLEALLSERRARYQEAADGEIPTDGRPVEDVVSDVIARWNAS